MKKVNYKQVLKQERLTEDELILEMPKAKRYIDSYNEDCIELEHVINHNKPPYSRKKYFENGEYTEISKNLQARLKSRCEDYNELIISEIALLVDKKEAQAEPEIISIEQNQPGDNTDKPDNQIEDKPRSRGFLGLF